MGGPVYFEIYERFEGRKHGLRFQLNDISDLNQSVTKEIQNAFHKEHKRRKMEAKQNSVAS